MSTVRCSTPPGGATRTWDDYYRFRLTWYTHLRNILHHWPLIREAARRAPRRILDVGSGSGSLAIGLSYLSRHVVSVDVSQEIVERCRQHNRRLLGRVDFRRANAFHLDDFSDDSFEVAVSQGFFEHFADTEIQALLSEQLRVAPIALFSVPNAAYGRRDYGDERLMTGEEWASLAASLGFAVLERRDYRLFTTRLWRAPASMTLVGVTWA